MRIAALNHSNLSKIPNPCRSCTYWLEVNKELGKLGVKELESLQAVRIKRILTEWGNCGFIAYDDKQPVGYALFGPPSFFPKIGEHAAGPVSPDAIFLACIHIMPDHRGSGIGEQLLMAVEKQVLKKKYKALELFGARADNAVPANPMQFYLERGFYIKRDDHRFPLLRLDVKSLAAWHESVEAALKQLSKPLGATYPKKAPVPL